jgi:hypothetical protein
MGRRMRLRHLPARMITGAFILNSGLSKLQADEEAAGQMHGMAVSTYPFLAKLDAKTFTKALATGEITLGAALLLPVVPTALAGLGLSAFAGGLLGLYLRLPGMRQEDGIRPTQQGTPLAKDSWLLGMGLSLVMDSVTDREDKKKAELKAAKKAAKEAKREAKAA